MFTNRFRLRTVWHLEGTREELRGLTEDLMADAGVLQRVWSEAFDRAFVAQAGGDRAAGRVVALRTRGFLPYRLDWQVRLVESREVERYVFEAAGDFVGRAVWRIRETRRGLRVTLDWRLSVAKPLLRRLVWLLKPLFVSNHRWAMARGRESLQRELRRRRAAGPVPLACAG